METIAAVVIAVVGIIGVTVLGFFFIRSTWRKDEARLAWLRARNVRLRENAQRVREEQQRLRDQQK